MQISVNPFPSFSRMLEAIGRLEALIGALHLRGERRSLGGALHIALVLERRTEETLGFVKRNFEALQTREWARALLNLFDTHLPAQLHRPCSGSPVAMNAATKASMLLCVGVCEKGGRGAELGAVQGVLAALRVCSRPVCSLTHAHAHARTPTNVLSLHAVTHTRAHTHTHTHTRTHTHTHAHTHTKMPHAPKGPYPPERGEVQEHEAHVAALHHVRHIPLHVAHSPAAPGARRQGCCRHVNRKRRTAHKGTHARYPQALFPMPFPR